MASRYEKPPVRPPSPANLAYLLSDARPTIGDYQTDGKASVEHRRADAIAGLLMLAREYVGNADDIEPLPREPRTRLRAMPLELRSFLEVEGLRILLADDPVEATRRFLGKIRGRGRPIDDNERRNILIAAAVAELVHGGSTIDDACEAVEKEAPVGFEMVRKIYLKRRDTLDVRVEVGFHLNEGQEKSNGG